jgi:putative endonuclease
VARPGTADAVEPTPVVAGPGAAKAGMANAVGAYGERLAARYLIESGMQILDRNWRCDQGEIDIVAMDETCLVIVEVKTRRSLAFGSPVEAVTAAKAARLRRLAACWLADHRTLVVGAGDVRIDVVGVLRPAHGAARIEHLVAVAA